MTGRAVLVTVLLTLAVLVKSIAAPLLVLWLWHVWRGGRGAARRTSLTVATHAAGVVGPTLAFLLPVQAGWGTLRALLSVTSRQGWASGPGLIARGARTLGRAVGGAATGAALETAASAAFAALFLILFWRLLRNAGSEPEADRWGGAILLIALAAPYLLPWYAAWFVPFLGLMEDRVLAVAGLLVAGLLALTGVPAEAGRAPHAWSDMVLAVHYGAAPVMLALLGVVASRMARLSRGGTPAPAPEAPAPLRA